MQNTLIIRLLAETNDVEWMLQDGSGQVIKGPERGDISQVDNLDSKECQVWILVPGIDVLLTQIELPKLTQAKLRKAVPFALEEQLADDVKNLHFALGKVEVGKPLQIAVVSKEKMGIWLDQITSLQKNPHFTIAAMLPDTLALEREDNAWSILVENQTATVHSENLAGFVCDRENLNTLLQAQLSAADTKPEKIKVYGDIQLDIADMKIEQKTRPENALDLFDWQISSGSINLLQDEYQIRHQPEQTQQLFKYAGALALACLLIITVSDVFKLSYLSSQESSLEDQVAVVYKQIFPKATSVVSPKKRIQRLLGTMQSSQSKSDFLSLVAEVGPVIRKNDKLTIQEAAYSNNELQLRVEVTDFSVLDQFSQQVRALGFTVTQSSAGKSGNVIQSRIMIKRQVV